MHTVSEQIARMRHTERLEQAAMARLQAASRSRAAGRPRRWGARSSRLDGALLELAATPLFAGLSPRELQAVARSADRFQAPAGAVLARAEQPSAQFVVLTGGIAEASDAVDPRLLSAGDHFGELTVLEVAPQVPTVRAVTAVRGFAFGRRGFWDAVAQTPSLAVRLACSLGERLALSRPSLGTSDYPGPNPLEPERSGPLTEVCVGNVSSLEPA